MWVGWAWVGLRGVRLRVGVVDGVEEAGIAAEGAEEVDGGFVAVEDVHLPRRRRLAVADAEPDTSVALSRLGLS